MTTNYPGALDTTTQLKNDAIDSTVTAGLHAPQHNNVADAILAIEAELGISPSGAYSTVAAAIAASPTLTPATDQIFQGSADVVPLIAKLGSALDISNLFEARNASNTILAYITRLGLLSASALSISGTPLASTHLSDTASLARLAGPTFTGVPAAPTAAADTNTTQLATTAFVIGQAYAKLASPTFTGTPAAPTAALDTSTTQLATTAFVMNQLALATNAQSGTTYTLVLSDHNSLVELNNASAITLTVPPNASVAFAIGDTVNLLQTGAGQVTVVGGSGVTVNGNPGLKLTGQWAAATLIKRATNTWAIIGSLSA